MWGAMGVFTVVGIIISTMSLRSLYLSANLNLYCWATAAYLFLYQRKYRDLGPTLCVSLLSAFIIADYWEIPVFVYGYLGSFAGRYAQYIQQGYLIHHVYVLACCWLFQRLTGFHFNRKNASLILVALGLSFLFLSPFCDLVPYRAKLARLIPLILVGYALFEGSDKEWKPLVKRV